MRLANKVALITGSTKGIGEASAYHFAREGAKIIVVGRNEERGKTVVDKIQGNGGEAVFVQMDHTDEDQVRSAMDQAVRAFGKLDILINNAAPTDIVYGGDRSVVKIKSENWDRIVQTALYGPMLCTKYAVPHMIEGGGGSIVNISSGVTQHGFKNMSAYSCGKAALEQMTKTVASDFGKQGIRCNTVNVGFVLSNEGQFLAEHAVTGPAILATLMVPYYGRVEDITPAILFLASDEARYITGAMLLVDGGGATMAHNADLSPALAEKGISRED